MDKKSYYAVIPAFVRYHPGLGANEKLLYGELTALCNQLGYCWATNSYFAELYGCTERAVSRWIGNLAKHGFVRIEISQDAGNERKVYIIDATDGVTTKLSIGSRQKSREGIDKIVYQNNTVNTTENKRGAEAPQTEPKEPTPGEFARMFFEQGMKWVDNPGASEDAEQFVEIGEWMVAQWQNRILCAREIKKFILFWSEPSKSGRKQRWEMQPTFDVKRRVRTWMNKATGE